MDFDESRFPTVKAHLDHILSKEFEDLTPQEQRDLAAWEGDFSLNPPLSPAEERAVLLDVWAFFWRQGGTPEQLYPGDIVMRAECRGYFEKLAREDKEVEKNE